MKKLPKIKSIFYRYSGAQYRNSTNGPHGQDSSISRIPSIVQDGHPYAEVIMISNSTSSLSNASSLNNSTDLQDHSSLVSVLRSDLRDDVGIDPSGSLDSQDFGPPPSYDSLEESPPPSYYGAIRMRLYDWMMEKQQYDQ